MRFSKYIYVFLFNIINGLSLFIVDGNAVDVLLVITTTIFSLIFFVYFEFRIKKNITLILILGYLFCCHTILPILVFIDFIAYDVDSLKEQFLLSLYYYNSIFIVYLIFKDKWKYKQALQNYSRQSKYTINHNLLVIGFFLIVYSLSAFSFTVGLGVMGTESVALPFKLAGIINSLRVDIAPFFFVIVFSVVEKKGSKKQIYQVIIIYFIWCLFEAFVRLSRSAFIEYLFPIILYLALTKIYNIISIIKIIGVVLGINFVLYPVITTLRALGGASISNIKEAQTNEIEDKYQKIFKRTFSNAFFFERYRPYLTKDFFNFQNVPMIVVLGGSHNYTTIVVDNLERISDRHNSGTTGLADSILIGGIGFSIFSLVLTTIFAIYLDSYKIIASPIYRVFGVYIIRWLVWFRSWSLLFDPVQIIVFIIIYLIVRKK